MRNSFVNLATTGAVLTGEGVLSGMFVNTTSSGTIRIWHGTTSANVGRPITTALITPSAGYTFLGNLSTTAGVYVGVQSGSIDITFHIIERD